VAAYREAAAILDANSVEYLVLKGFTQAPDFVSRPELRRQGDIDFFVPREQISAAVRGLKEIGYASCDAEEYYRYADHVPTLVRFGTWKWSGNNYDPEVPLAVEIHFCLWNEAVSLIAVQEIEEFWKRRRVRTWGELIFPALDRPDHLAYFALHILRNVFSAEPTLHHVRELATFLDRSAGDDPFWRAWTVTHSPRLRTMQAVAFSLAAAWFSCKVPDAARAEIECLSRELRNWIETCCCAPLGTLFRRTRDGRLLQFLLAETRESRKKILWKALGPGRISGPETRASAQTHPTMSARPKLISSYLAYPGYICSRVWLNGWAVLRILVNFRKVHSSRRTGPAQSWMRRSVRMH
jgi:hypothetical protein